MRFILWIVQSDCDVYSLLLPFDKLSIERFEDLNKLRYACQSQNFGDHLVQNVFSLSNPDKEMVAFCHLLTGYAQQFKSEIIDQEWYEHSYSGFHKDCSPIDAYRTCMELESLDEQPVEILDSFLILS